MFSVDNRKILAIADWLQIGVNSLQRRSYELFINCLVRHSCRSSLKAVNTNLWPINNRQNVVILCTKHVAVIRQTHIFSAPISKEKLAVWLHEISGGSSLAWLLYGGGKKRSGLVRLCQSPN